nr:immunoglobulin heavy chain junction region [Mus musculus]
FCARHGLLWYFDV